MAALFDLRSGELVGAGCRLDARYLKARIRAHCRRYAFLAPDEMKRLEGLLAEYEQNTFWWRSRNGCLVSAVCRDAARYATGEAA